VANSAPALLLPGTAVGPSPASDHLVFRVRGRNPGLKVSIRLWNLAGELMRSWSFDAGVDERLFCDLRTPGGQALAHGVYVARLEASDPASGRSDTRNFKIVVVRQH
jgi:hypothetical protein